MQKYLSQANFTTLLDTLIADGKRVVAPRLNAGTVLYEPLKSAAEIVVGQLPRRSGKEAFFPLCEDIMSYEKEGQKVNLKDIIKGKKRDIRLLEGDVVFVPESFW